MTFSFPWGVRRRRLRLLEAPFPPAWATLLDRMPGVVRLGAGERARLRDIVRVLVAEKRFEGCGGLVLDDAMRVTIAAQAARLLVGGEHDYFGNVTTILVYPSSFRGGEQPVGGGLVATDVGLAGLASHHQGPVLLAWDAVAREAFGGDGGRNLVLHEFAHKLDLVDGWADGMPGLSTRKDRAAWRALVRSEFDAHVEATRIGLPTVLDAYGATNLAEFFAVATETFFEDAASLQEALPALYGLLRAYYHQDPATA